MSVTIELGKYVVPYFHEAVAVTAYLTIRLATSVFFSSVIVNLRTWSAWSCSMLPEVIALTCLRITIESSDFFRSNAYFLGPDIKCLIILSIDRWIKPVLFKT